jgi:hypothetical protein
VLIKRIYQLYGLRREIVKFLALVSLREETLAQMKQEVRSITSDSFFYIDSDDEEAKD